MAILNTGRFVPATDFNANGKVSRDTVRVSGSRTQYTYDCDFRKEDPTKIVKWLRRNFGDRGTGWDFIFNKGCVIIEIWDPKLKTMYEMWIV